MNERSSRSHAIIMLLLREERTMTTTSGETIRTAGKNSRMNLVDLAGSERVAQSQVEGQQFKEATHINLSLTTLGRVIDVLADMAKKGARAQYTVAPFRDSKLTFILRDSLGGNSKTFMIATVSPSALNYEETLSTLRYASRARDIVNVAQVNEDPRARRIRELEEQMADMRKAMAGGDPAYVSELKEKLTLLESEAQKRAADLQALEREREKNEIRDLMLKATEAERLELLERADALEQEVALSRAQAERMELENKRLHDLHREKEALLRAREASLEKHCAEMRRRECSIANHQEEWQVSIKEERRQHDTLLLQLKEADERNFHLSNFFRHYATDMRRCMDAILSTALLECRQGVDVAQASVVHLTAASCELQSQVTNLKEELRQAESALTDAHMKNEKLSADATAAAAQHAHQLNDVNSQLDQLRRELEAAALENGTLRTQLDETTKELDNKNASLEKALHSAYELRGQLESATAAVAQLEAQNCAYSAAVQVATDENKTLSAHLAQLQDEEQRLSESLQKQQQIAIDLAYFDERWTFPDPKDATETTSHTKSFPQTEWKLLLQKKPLELHSIFRTEAALACHVRQSHITSLHFQLGSLQATFNVQHPITISKHQIQQRLDTYPFRAMQEMYESRNNPPSGLDALRGQLEEAHQQLEEAGAEKDSPRQSGSFFYKKNPWSSTASSALKLPLLAMSDRAI
ncbi:kinesin K39, putative [Leishmania guyanensis]